MGFWKVDVSLDGDNWVVIECKSFIGNLFVIYRF